VELFVEILGSWVAPSKVNEARLVSAPVGSVNAPSLVPTIEPTVTNSSKTPLREARTPHSTVVVDVQLVLAQGRFTESPRDAVGVKQAPKLSPAIVTVPPVRPMFQAQADENPGAEIKKCGIQEALSHSNTHTTSCNTVQSCSKWYRQT
jgi:hypothetical protein